MPDEMTLLRLALAGYLAATLAAVLGAARGRAAHGPVLGLMAVALALHAWSIALRWVRLEHGPYVDLFEILSSNVLSLHLVLFLLAVAIPLLRAALATALPVLAVLVVWLLLTPARDTMAPVTYETVWLPVHMLLGKLFLGLAAAATGLGLVVVLRRATGLRLPHAPACAACEALAHRLMLTAVLFQTLMLVAGAAWARDAWGRYWAWDPLESWSFLTWLAMLGYLHLRPHTRQAPAWNAVLVVGVFLLAFATFFGVPFLSTAPHKGAV